MDVLDLGCGDGTTAVPTAERGANADDFISAVTWGVENNVRECFSHAGSPAAEFLDDFKRYYGPTMNAFEAAVKGDRADELREELKTRFEEQNQGGSQCTVIPATYLKVSVKEA